MEAILAILLGVTLPDGGSLGSMSCNFDVASAQVHVVGTFDTVDGGTSASCSLVVSGTATSKDGGQVFTTQIYCSPTISGFTNKSNMSDLKSACLDATQVQCGWF